MSDHRHPPSEHHHTTGHAGGYALEAHPLVVEPGRTTPWTLRVRNSAGGVERAFGVEHERPMHLIVVRRDLAHFQHLHPELSDDGTWSLPLTLPEAGSYRAFADFVLAGDGHPRTLGIELQAPGLVTPAAALPPSNLAETNGYEVRLNDAPRRAGSMTRLSFAVSRDGVPVHDLEPYLGARGHLVVLAEADLSYLHVHPAPTAGPTIEFQTAFPDTGRFRLFLQFAHGGRVHTAELAIVLG